MYKARPDNLVFPQLSDPRPDFPTNLLGGGDKFGWHPGYGKASGFTFGLVQTKSEFQQSEFQSSEFQQSEF